MTEARYSSVAVVLHWAIAVLILGQVAGGLYMHDLPNTSPDKFSLYQLHKSFGLSILTLTVLRLGWRLVHKVPALPTALPYWQKLIARITHWLFYALLILTPLAGWAIVSVSPNDIPTKWFGLFNVPHLPFFNDVTDRHAAEEIMEERHEFLAFAILWLLALHIGAALKHKIIDRDGVLRSMLPASPAQWLGITGVLGALIVAGLLYLASPAHQSNAVALPQHSPDEHAEAYDDTVASPDPPSWIVDPSESSLKFIGEESDRSFEGAFSNFTADIKFDPANLGASSINVTIQTASAATGEELQDATIPGREWFDVKNHPTATFSSSSITKTGEGKYAAIGTLTIKEFSKEITLSFSLEINGDNGHATGGVDLVRTNYGLGMDDSWLDEEKVGLNVRVEFEITATRRS